MLQEVLGRGYLRAFEQFSEGSESLRGVFMGVCGGFRNVSGGFQEDFKRS